MEIGKKLKEAEMKKESLVVLISRNHTDLIPDGDTTIEAGDTLVIYSASEYFSISSNQFFR